MFILRDAPRLAAHQECLAFDSITVLVEKASVEVSFGNTSTSSEVDKGVGVQGSGRLTAEESRVGCGDDSIVLLQATENRTPISRQICNFHRN
jgi:hypothetical protein